MNEEKEINFYIENNNLSPKYLLNTHCHIDQILGNNFIKNNWDVKFGIHKLENELLKNSKIIADNYGIENFKESPKPDFFIEENQVIEIFELKLRNNFMSWPFTRSHFILRRKQRNYVLR